MTTTYDCTAADQRAEGLEHAQRAIRQHKCVVFPTDTVYGIAADAFSPQAVTMLLVSKGRSRQMPPPVLIPRLNALDGLATDVSAEARKLAEAFWPGGLTMIFHAQPSLDWDLGETKGTVALRMPADDVAQDLLTLTGPLAVSSANRTGQPRRPDRRRGHDPARGIGGGLPRRRAAAGGRRGREALPSTIVDATALPLRVVRQGAISAGTAPRSGPGPAGHRRQCRRRPASEAEPDNESVAEPEAGSSRAPLNRLPLPNRA